jgi:maleylacetoacetate isomerase
MGAAAYIRLHTRAQNSAGERVRIVLGLKGIPYQYMPIRDLNSTEYRAINPQGLMPALEINGKTVTQSMAIMEMLDEIWPDPPLLPEDPVECAKVRGFAWAICADLHPVNNKRIRRFLQDELGVSDEGVRKWYHHWIAQTFSSLELTLKRRIKPTAFCFGDEPGLAEACLVPQMRNALRFECDLEPYPLLVAVDAACREIDAFQWAAPEAMPDWQGGS